MCRIVLPLGYSRRLALNLHDARHSLVEPNCRQLPPPDASGIEADEIRQYDKAECRPVAKDNSCIDCRAILKVIPGE